MTTETVIGTANFSTTPSLASAVSFMITNLVEGWIHTADVVRVVNVHSGGASADTGYVDVLPLVCQLDGHNEKIQPTTIFRLPYSRIQGGTAALVIDPCPGDIGIAVYTKRDSSLIGPGQQMPVLPRSFRTYDQADGFYIGGFLNKPPTIFLELDQSNNATLTAPESVTINTKNCSINCETFQVNASQSAGINASVWSFNTPDGSSTGSGTINANLTQVGTLESTGDHVANGISLSGHVHSGVQGGNGITGGPQ